MTNIEDIKKEIKEKIKNDPKYIHPANKEFQKDIKKYGFNSGYEYITWMQNNGILKNPIDVDRKHKQQPPKDIDQIKNIDQVKIILEENNIKIKGVEIFHRFWSKIYIKDNKEECWNWTAGTSNGYGQFRVYEEMVRSHRIAYMLTKGNIPEGLQVQHICNNPGCCNPNHLELGDNSKNQQYRSKCGRFVISYKLTEDQIREIHKLYNEQRKLHPELKQWQITEPIVEKFIIAKSTIDQILNGTQWHHIWKEFHK